ncbi:MAG: glycoside hydrolase family 9 protein [Bacteroidota bacterium]
MKQIRFLLLLAFFGLFINGCEETRQTGLKLNDLEYFEKPGLNVMAFSDFYPEGHQGGVSVILNGVRIASNGDVRLEPTPGQWQPIPKLLERKVDTVNEVISAHLQFPDSALDRKGFNPIIYPEGLFFTYTVRVEPAGEKFKIYVDMDKPVPEEWVGKIGFNFELFPGEYFGKNYYMDDKPGLFPRQLNGPMYMDEKNIPQAKMLASGQTLTVSPEHPKSMKIITSENSPLELYDGRAQHNNGWFVVRSPIPANKTKGALEWTVSANAFKDFLITPVVHTSQVGYHPKQQKVAVIELDKYDKSTGNAILYKVNPDGSLATVQGGTQTEWGNWLRYRYLKFDFTDVTESGLYKVVYKDQESATFKIENEVYDRHVWQPTLEYFLPVQMCHMRVNDRYRVWHGLCHMDDALMAPTDHNHFDGYVQGPSTLTKYKSGQHVPGLNTGGWHDAGDYDLRVESQIGTVQILSDIYMQFDVDYDATMIDQENKLTEMHRPDGIPDVLQQIEHGVLSVLGGYKSLGRLYRGIICNDLRQYVLLGDGSTMTDNLIYNPALSKNAKTATHSGVADDRWVFTEENPSRELDVAAGLATASLALKEYKPSLARECIDAAETIYGHYADDTNERLQTSKVKTLAELYLATGKAAYKDALLSMQPVITAHFDRIGWKLGKVISHIDNQPFLDSLNAAATAFKAELDEQEKENPFGVPYRPYIWGAGWGIQSFGVTQYYLHLGWPEIFDADYMLHALNFVLGVHPGDHSKSFASGVGVTSLEVAYGVNRAEWSYIPGGVGSGTALIRPDFPELKEWPFFWQQTEYVMGGGGSNFMFLALAADHLLNGE